MPNVRQPRSASLQFWPRRRAKREYARIRTHPISKESGLLGFAGYKAGMTHITATETKKTSHLKGEEISIPVTIIECPPIKIAGIVLYKKTINGLVISKHISFVKNDKVLSRRLKLPKKAVTHELDKLNPSEYVDARALVYTQPGLTGIGKKKPEIFY
jgi:large subunit ribosomal protein L3